MGATSSVQRDRKCEGDAILDEQNEMSNGVQDDVIIEEKNGQVSSLNGKKEGQLGCLNGHSKERAHADVDSVFVELEEDGPDMIDAFQGGDVPLIKAENDENEAVNDDVMTVKKIEDADDKLNEINVGFKRMFRFVGFKLTLKKDKCERAEAELIHEKEERVASATEESKDMKDGNFWSPGEQGAEKKMSDETATTGHSNEPEPEDLSPNIDNEVTEDTEANNEIVRDQEPDEEVPSNEGMEDAMSPIKRFFKQGIFSSLRRKKKPIEVEPPKESPEEELKTIANEEEGKILEDDTKDADPACVCLETTRDEVTLDKTAHGTDPQAGDTDNEKKMSPLESQSASEAGLSSAQDRAKVQGSPFKRLFRKLSIRRQRETKATETKPTEDEHVGDQPQSPPEITVCQEMDEPKPTDREQISDVSTGEPKKRTDSTVSWEALICGGSAKKRTRKTSDSEDDTQDNKGEEPEKAKDSPLGSSLEGDYDHLTSSNEETGSPSEGDGGSTWKSLKKLVTPKRKVKIGEHTLPEMTPTDGEIAKDETLFSIKKLLSGCKSRKPDETEDQPLSEEAGKSIQSDEDDETPALIPLSEYEIIEPETLKEELNEMPEDSAREKELSCLLTEEIKPEETLGLEISNASHDSGLSEPPITTNDFEEFTEFISKHQQLSDIPEEGIIEESITTSKSSVEWTAQDNTLAEDIVELTSEAVTAPEPPTEESFEDESTEMVSAVSQLTDSPQTSGNTTPILTEFYVKVPDVVLQEALETITVSENIVSITTMEESSFVAVSPDISESAVKEEKQIFVAHEKSEATAICTGLVSQDMGIEEIIPTPLVEGISEETEAAAAELTAEELIEASEATQIAENELFIAEVSLTKTEYKEIESISDTPLFETEIEIQEIPPAHVVEQSEVNPVQDQETTKLPSLPDMEGPIESEIIDPPCEQSAQVTEVTVGQKEHGPSSFELAVGDIEHVALTDVVNLVTDDMTALMSDTAMEETSGDSEPLLETVTSTVEIKEVKEAVNLVSPVPDSKIEDREVFVEEKGPLVSFVDSHQIQVEVKNNDVQVAETEVESVPDIALNDDSVIVEDVYNKSEKVDQQMAEAEPAEESGSVVIPEMELMEPCKEMELATLPPEASLVDVPNGDLKMVADESETVSRVTSQLEASDGTEADTFSESVVEICSAPAAEKEPGIDKEPDRSEQSDEQKPDCSEQSGEQKSDSSEAESYIMTENTTGPKTEEVSELCTEKAEAEPTKQAQSDIVEQTEKTEEEHKEVYETSNHVQESEKTVSELEITSTLEETVEVVSEVESGTVKDIKEEGEETNAGEDPKESDAFCKEVQVQDIGQDVVELKVDVETEEIKAKTIDAHTEIESKQSDPQHDVAESTTVVEEEKETSEITDQEEKPSEVTVQEGGTASCEVTPTMINEQKLKTPLVNESEVELPLVAEPSVEAKEIDNQDVKMALELDHKAEVALEPEHNASEPNVSVTEVEVSEVSEQQNLETTLVSELRTDIQAGTQQKLVTQEVHEHDVGSTAATKVETSAINEEGKERHGMMDLKLEKAAESELDTEAPQLSEIGDETSGPNKLAEATVKAEQTLIIPECTKHVAEDTATEVQIYVSEPLVETMEKSGLNIETPMATEIQVESASVTDKKIETSNDQTNITEPLVETPVITETKVEPAAETDQKMETPINQTYVIEPLAETIEETALKAETAVLTAIEVEVEKAAVTDQMVTANNLPNLTELLAETIEVLGVEEATPVETEIEVETAAVVDLKIETPVVTVFVNELEVDTPVVTSVVRNLEVEPVLTSVSKIDVNLPDMISAQKTTDTDTSAVNSVVKELEVETLTLAAEVRKVDEQVPEVETPPSAAEVSKVETQAQVQTPTPAAEVSKVEAQAQVQTATLAAEVSKVEPQAQVQIPTLAAEVSKVEAQVEVQTPTPAADVSKVEAEAQVQTPTPAAEVNKVETQAQVQTPTLAAEVSKVEANEQEVDTTTLAAEVSEVETHAQVQTPAPTAEVSKVETQAQVQTPTPAAEVSKVEAQVEVQTPAPTAEVSKVEAQVQEVDTTTLAAEASKVEAQAQVQTPTLAAEVNKVETQAQVQTPTPAAEVSKVEAQVEVQTPTPAAEVSKVEAQVQVQTPAAAAEVSKVEAQVQVQTPTPVAEVSKVEAQAQVQTPTPAAEVSKVEAQVQVQTPAAAVEMSKVEAQVQVQTPTPVAEVSKVEAQAQVQTPTPAAEVSKVEAQVQVQTPAAAAEVSKVEAQVQVQTPTPVAEVSKVEAQAQVQTPTPAAEVSKVEAQVQVQTPTPVAEVSKVEAQAQVQRPTPAAEVSKVEAQVQVQTPTLAAEVSKVEAQAQVQTPTPAAEVSKVEAQAQVQTPTPAAEVSKVEVQVQVQTPTLAVEVSKVETQSQVQTPTPAAEVSKVEAQVQVQTPTPVAEVSKVETQAQVQTPKPAAEVSKVEAQVQVQTPTPVAEVSKVETQAQVQTPTPAAEVSKVEAQVQVQTPTPVAEVSKVETQAQVQTPKPAAEVSKVEAQVQVQTPTPVAEVSKVETQAQVQTPKPAAEVSKVETQVQVQTPTPAAEVSKVEAQVQVQTPAAAAEVSKVEAEAQVQTPTLAVEVSKVETQAQVQRPTPAAEVSKVEAEAQVQTPTPAAEVCKVEARVQVQTPTPAAEVSKAQAQVQVQTPILAAEVSKVEVQAQIQTPTPAAEVSKVEAPTPAAEVSKVEAQVQAVPSDAQLEVGASVAVPVLQTPVTTEEKSKTSAMSEGVDISSVQLKTGSKEDTTPETKPEVIKKKSEAHITEMEEDVWEDAVDDFNFKEETASSTIHKPGTQDATSNQDVKELEIKSQSSVLPENAGACITEETANKTATLEAQKSTEANQ